MKHLLLTTIAAVVLLGYEPSPEGELRSAVIDGNIAAVKKHITYGVDVSAKNTYGWTALHFADNKEIAKLLIAEGANLNAKDYGKTTLQ